MIEACDGRFAFRSPSLAISKGLALLNPGNRFLSRQGRDNAGTIASASHQRSSTAAAVAQRAYLSPCGRESDFNILAGAERRLSVRNRKRGAWLNGERRP
jgi:hypothetical protein